VLVATCLGARWRTSVLDDAARAIIRQHAELVDLDPRAPDGFTVAAAARVLVTGWGAPPLDAAVLDRLPDLELVAHAAGSVRGVVTGAAWRRGIRVSTATAANAVSVADFTAAQIHLSLKNAWRLAARSRRDLAAPDRFEARGVDTATIGLIGLGHIGRLVAERLRAQDVAVLAYDPHASDVTCARLGVTRHDLATVFARADVLSVHAPLTESTRGMIGRELIESLRPHATLINTARGGLIDHDALTVVLTERPDLFALLDVTDPEPLPPGHPLFGLDNTVITPHIAGCVGTDVARLGRAAAEEVARFAAGVPLAHELTEGRAAFSA